MGINKTQHRPSGIGLRARFVLIAMLASALALPWQTISASDLHAAGNKVARALAKSNTAHIKRVVLSPSDFFDAGTHTVLPLSEHIRSALARDLTAAGFRVMDRYPANRDVWIIQCSWRDRGDRAALTYMASPWTNGTRGTVKIIPSAVPSAALAGGLLVPDARSYAHTLVHRLALNERLSQRNRVYLKPVTVAGTVGGSPLNQYFTQWLGDAVAASNLLVSVDVGKALATLERRTFRTRGIRPKKKTSMSLTGALTAAKNEIAAEVKLVGTEALSVFAVLRDDEGDEVSRASVKMPMAEIPAALQTRFQVPDITELVASAPVVNNDLEVELSTTRGEGVASYKAGDKITFLVRVNKDALIYLFDFDAAGEAYLLYPAFDAPHTPARGGELLILPDDGLSYDLEVTPPFGKDLVWAVAVDRPLDVPRELTGQWAKTKVTMERVRAMAAAAGAYSEAQLVVETRQ
jgi:hypothetical protein